MNDHIAPHERLYNVRVKETELPHDNMQSSTRTRYIMVYAEDYSAAQNTVLNHYEKLPTHEVEILEIAVTAIDLLNPSKWKPRK